MVTLSQSLHSVVHFPKDQATSKPYCLSYATGWSSRVHPESSPPRAGRESGLKLGHPPLAGRPEHQDVALTDAPDNLVRFVLLPGHRYDSVRLPSLIEDIAVAGLIAGKALHSTALTVELNERGACLCLWSDVDQA